MIHLNLNKELYSDQAIAISLADFKDVCEIEKVDSGSYNKIIFHCEDAEVALEFSNYVLTLEKAKRGTT